MDAQGPFLNNSLRPDALDQFVLADHARPGAIYSVTRTGGFTVGAVYTTVASDNPTLANTLGTLDLATGQITAAVAGFKGPKGLIYLS